MRTSIKSFIVASLIGLASVATSVSAHGNDTHGSTGISGSASGFAGNVVGSAGSWSNGSAVSSAQVNGYGSSWQTATGYTGGTATIGGQVTHQGAQVISNTTQYSHSDAYGEVSGNAPIMVGNAIANGSASFGETKVNAGGTANFGTAAIGGGFQINGWQSFGYNR